MSLRSLGACTAIALLLVACAPDDTNGGPAAFVSEQRAPSAGGSGPQLHPGSSFVTPDLSNDVDVFDDRLVFPAKDCEALSRYHPGDIILGDARSQTVPGTNNPEGFIRRVRTVTCGDKVVVVTDPATLPDAFDKLALDTGFTLPTCDKTVNGPSLGFEYDKTLFDYTDTAKMADGRAIPFNATASVQASLCFAPRYTLKADIGFLEVKSFEVSATGELSAQMFFNVATKLPSAVDAKTLAELAGKPLTKSFLVDLPAHDIAVASVGLGDVKLPITVHSTATLACDFTFTAPAAMKVGASASVSVTAGVSYKDDKLTPIFDKNASFTPTPPTFTTDGLVQGTCTVTPNVELRIFGLASSALGLPTRVGLGASQSCAAPDAQGVSQKTTTGDVDAAVSATVLAKLDLFGKKKWTKQCTLFSAEGAAHYDRTYPSPGGAKAVCTPLGPFAVPPPPAANPAACFGETADANGTPAPAAIIPGTCTHDVCTSGEKLGQACDPCTMQVCAEDSYCCDTYWGGACFERVQRLCAKTCSP